MSATATTATGRPEVAPSVTDPTRWTADPRLLDRVAATGAVLLLMAISALIAWNLDYAPDEASHRQPVEVLAREHRKLDWRDTRYGVERGHAYHLYSPVAYLPYVPAQWLADAIGPVDGARKPDMFVVRLGGLGFALAQFAATVALVARLGRGLSRREVLAIALAVNLAPQIRYMHAYVTTDAMSLLAGTLAATTALRVLQRTRLDLRDALMAGGAIALCAHVRYNALFVAALLAGAVAFRTIRPNARTDDGQPVEPIPFVDRLRVLGAAAAVALTLGLPFQLHVYEEQANGHLTASISHEQLRESSFSGRFSRDLDRQELIDFRIEEAGSVAQGMWLRFQEYAEAPPQWWKYPTWVTAAGLLVLVASRSTVDRRAKVVTGLLMVAFVVTWVAMAAQWPFTSNGRFLLPAGVPLLAAGMVGWASLLRERTPLPSAGLLVAAGWSLVMLRMVVWGISQL